MKALIFKVTPQHLDYGQCVLSMVLGLQYSMLFLEMTLNALIFSSHIHYVVAALSHTIVGHQQLILYR